MKKKTDHSGLLGASLLALGALTAPAYAQDQTMPAADDSDEEIVVVGSRIRRDNFNAPSPIQVLTREESTRAGLASTTEVLQSTAATGGAAQLNNLFGGFVVNGGTGVNTIGLRGFGPTETLVLINGRRLSPAGVRGAVGAADLNTIPSALVDRIEILKDGASSVYGSDAVAGVVNIITNQNIDGFILEGQHNFVERGGGEQTRLSLVGGRDFGDLSLTGSVEYYERAAVTYAQRDFTRCPIDLVRDPATGDLLDDVDPVTGELKCWGINFVNSPGTTLNTIGTASRAGYGGPGAALTGNFTRWRPNAFIDDGAGGRLDGFEGVNGGGLQGFRNRDTFDPEMLDQELITPTNTLNIFLQAQYQLGGGHELYGEALYSRRESRGANYVQLTLDYPNNELLPPELRAGAVFSALSTFPATLPSNVPMPAAYPTQVRGFIGFGLTDATQEVEYTRYVAGIRGEIGFLDNWRYDANVYFGRNDSVQLQQNFLTDRVFNSLVIDTNPVNVAAAPANLVRRTPSGTSYICAVTVTNPGYGCIPAPALTAATIGGNLPGDWVNWIQQTLPETTEYDERALQFVVDGPLFSLPAGQVQAVFGLEYRNAEVDDTPEFNNINNNIYNYSSAQPTRGEDSVREGFAEIEVPILRDAQFAESLTLNLSGRYTDYESYGSGSTYKIGLTWEPVQNLMFRYTRGTSFRAPALFEQFLGAQSGFQPSNTDPCNLYGSLSPTNQVYINCDAEIGDTSFVQTHGVTVYALGGQANDLSAETSENETIGFTWRPIRDVDGIGDISLAVDRFSIEVNDQVAQLGYRNIFNLCYNSPDPATEPTCALITRDPSNAVTINNSYLNIASQKAEGFDIGARYRRSLFNGELSVVANMVLFNTQTFQLLPQFDATDTNGTIGVPEMAGDLSVNYEQGPWALHYGVSWIAEMDDYNALEEDPATSFFVLSTPDYFLHDASVQYNADAWRFTVGVRNLFDETPPQVSSVDPLFNGLGSTPFYSGFDMYGRQFFVNVSTRF